MLNPPALRDQYRKHLAPSYISDARAVSPDGRVITGLGLYRLRSLFLQVFSPETDRPRFLFSFNGRTRTRAEIKSIAQER
jgi:hypothetical protein